MSDPGALACTGGMVTTRVVACQPGQATPRDDWLVEEVPVALVVNGLSHAVMLATPVHLGDFALGFALTEGLIEQASELYGVEVATVDGGIELRLDVSAAREWALRERRRTLAGRTGCGLCGTESLSQVRLPLPALMGQPLSRAAVARAQADLRHHQPIQQRTGASHAAAWCSPEGELRLVREDVGRHNALDKLVGALRRARLNPHEGFVLVTSRASFEMVQKCARAGVATLAAVSAPTSLAVQTAREAGVLLAGFVRGDNLVAYTFPERLNVNVD